MNNLYFISSMDNQFYYMSHTYLIYNKSNTVVVVKIEIDNAQA